MNLSQYLIIFGIFEVVAAMSVFSKLSKLQEKASATNVVLTFKNFLGRDAFALISNQCVLGLIMLVCTQITNTEAGVTKLGPVTLTVFHFFLVITATMAFGGSEVLLRYLGKTSKWLDNYTDIKTGQGPKVTMTEAVDIVKDVKGVEAPPKIDTTVPAP